MREEPIHEISHLAIPNYCDTRQGGVKCLNLNDFDILLLVDPLLCLLVRILNQVVVEAHMPESDLFLLSKNRALQRMRREGMGGGEDIAKRFLSRATFSSLPFSLSSRPYPRRCGHPFWGRVIHRPVGPRVGRGRCAFAFRKEAGSSISFELVSVFRFISRD